MKHVFLLAGLLICSLVHANVKASHETTVPRHQVTAVQNTEQRLDSVVALYQGTLNHKIIYAYDMQGRVLEESVYYFKGSNNKKIVHTYNGEEQTTTEYQLDDNNSPVLHGYTTITGNDYKISTYYENGTPIFRDEYQYNEWNDQILWLTQDYMNNQWVNRGKHETTYTYDAGKMVSAIASRYVYEESWRLDETTEATYEYDEQGRESSIVSRITKDGVSTNNSKLSYMYDTDGNCVTISYNWQEDSWQEISQSEYMYDNEGNITQYIGYSWDSANRTWLPTRKVDQIYQAGMLVEKTEFYWNQRTSAWTGSYKATYQYNAWGNLEYEMSYSYNTSIEAFVGAMERTYYYSEPNLNPTNIKNIFEQTVTIHKIFENGTIYIIRNGEKYTVDGRRVM